MNTSKIIKGAVSNGRYTVTAPIIKEDYGLYLKIEGVELPQTYEVDFSNSESNGTSVTMIGNADGVLIPSQFIASGKDIFAFLYHVGADFGRTVYKFRIPNKLRPDRTNEEPTPTQQSVIDQAIAALNDAMEQTAQDVIDADASAQNASADAERAEEARTDAQNYATQAEQSATDAHESASQASASATASAQSASQSAQIKADVEGLADDAQGYASASAQSASASANSASQAQGFAQSASASASSASGYASSAQGSANTASSKATEASGYAQTASEKASEASQSATTASNKASEASGYATSAQTAQGKAEDAQTAAETAQGLAESARDSAIQAKNDAESAVASISGALNDKADIITDTASGSIASFSDGADDLPLKSLVVDINPIQDLSNGDPSPTNICPISGWTNINVNHSDADTTNPTTLTIDLGQTVYGAKLYPLEGKAVITHGYFQKNTADMNNSETYPGWIKSGVRDIVGADIGGAIQNAILNIGRYVAVNTRGINDIVYLPTSFYSKTQSEWQALALDVQIVVPLAEPIEIQLTPNQVNSLLGVNNIWADSGDCTAEYRADTKLYIERLTAPDSEDMIADANITSGQYFMVGDSLYKATANIANGSAIVVGTNCIRKSLSEALNEINA